jgi:predicted ATPase/DNA-binding CsgD family transcriptional regulator
MGRSREENICQVADARGLGGRRDILNVMPLEPHKLPRSATSFVGRGSDLRIVAGLAEENALVTLAGPGGAGKTRLALEAATRIDAEQAGIDVRWVELAELGGDSLVAHAVADAVGALVSPEQDPTSAVTSHLVGRQMLLCLDNAEHLLESVAALADTITRACPAATVLVTSREPLGLAGEVVWRVPPMVDDDAEALFVQRAVAVRASYQPDTDDAAAIAGIVRHLDGIPLALELAAAWLDTLSPKQVLAGLDDRFRLLVRGPRNALRRHQTLAGSISWSHAQLDDVDRALFRRLAVFAGTFSLEAALEVGAGAPVPDGGELHALARLVDKSLVMADHADGVTRYRMLETIRAFAMARLVDSGEAAICRERHISWYVDLAEATDQLRRHAPDRSRETLQREYVDLRAALDRSLDSDDTEPARRLAASLAWLWHDGRHGPEGLRYLRRAIDLEPHNRSAVQARLLAGIALVADTAAPLGLEYDAAIAALELADEIDDAALRGLCLNLAAVGAFYTDFDRAWELTGQAAEAAPDDEFTVAAAQALRALVLHHRDRHDEADERFSVLQPRMQQLHRGIASTLLAYQALGALVTGDTERGRDLAADAVRVADPLGDHLRVGIARGALAVLLARTGRPDEADAVLEPLLRLPGASSGDVFITGLSRAAGVVAECRGDLRTAAQWFRRDASLTDDGVDSWIAATSLADLGRVLVATGNTQEAGPVVERAVKSASRLGMPRVLASAYLAQAALAACDPDGLDQAIQIGHEALAVLTEHGVLAALPSALEALACHGAAIRGSADDVRLAAAATAARSAYGLPRLPVEETSWSSFIEGIRTHLGSETFDAAWDEGSQLSLDQAVKYARRARGSRGRPSAGWASLTPTELEVTALIAEGLSNPEIAKRLLMGRGTVKTHLAHIFAKMGVANRTELATLATSRDTQ